MRQTAPTRHGRILIVEDDRSIREILAEVLADEGYDVSLARNGQEALEICHTMPVPDLILLDLQMPIMDGAEFACRKDAEPALAGIPLCVMTASDASASIPSGASAVLRKPLGCVEVIAIARRFCGSRVG